MTFPECDGDYRVVRRGHTLVRIDMNALNRFDSEGISDSPTRRVADATASWYRCGAVVQQQQLYYSCSTEGKLGNQLIK